jgi:G3E family GTPase
MMGGRIPVHVLTGFLGSGKTTLLNRVLSQQAWSDSAVLINEIGAVAIDHDLIERIDSTDAQHIVLLKGGCTCCALRGDMVSALRELYQRRVDGLVPPFARIVMETTGLADPAPILYTLIADPVLRHKFERGLVVTTFDAAHGLDQLRRHPEARQQLAFADRVVLTKTDLDAAAQRMDMIGAIRRLNPLAAIVNVAEAATPAVLLHEADMPPSLVGVACGPYELDKLGLFDGAYGADKSHERQQQHVAAHLLDAHVSPSASFSQRGATGSHFADKLCDMRSELGQTVPLNAAPSGGDHSANVSSISIVLDEPIDWSRLSVWLTLLLHAHGAKMLRFKALLNVAGWPAPVVLDAVHHMIHPPKHIGRWQNGPRTSRLVFIAQDFQLERIAPSLRRFLAGDFVQAASVGFR